MVAQLVDARISWLDESVPLRLSTTKFEELRVSRDGDLLLRDWTGETRVLLRDRVFFLTSRHVACAIRSASGPASVALLGEEGGMLVKIDLDHVSWALEAEVPRVENRTGGLCYLRPVIAGDLVIVFWELGVLALDRGLELRWRHDLEWNHEVIHLDENQVWFDLMYESDEIPQKIGERPWGYSFADGRELFDASPPKPRILP